MYAVTTEAYTRALKLTQSQYAAGVALRSDVALAESQLKTAQAQGVDLQAQRSQLEHAIAILTGRAPAAFALPRRRPPGQLRCAPAGDPGGLALRAAGAPPRHRRGRTPRRAGQCQHRRRQGRLLPVADAERQRRLQRAGFATLFDTPSRVWSLGAALAQTLFDGGLRRARSDQAVAAYDVAVAQYKQTVLNGFQQVEDNLALLRVLDHETGLQDQAVKASQLAERLALSQYRAGTATYLAVVTAQTLSLDEPAHRGAAARPPAGRQRRA